jgi:hypothetical protein
MTLLSAADVAIAAALNSNTLCAVERPSRFGGTFIALSDEAGLIEVQDTWADAEARIAAIRSVIRKQLGLN